MKKFSKQKQDPYGMLPFRGRLSHIPFKLERIHIESCEEFETCEINSVFMFGQHFDRKKLRSVVQPYGTVKHR